MSILLASRSSLSQLQRTNLLKEKSIVKMTGTQDFIFYIKHIYHVPQCSTVATEYSLLVFKPEKCIDTIFNFIT